MNKRYEYGDRYNHYTAVGCMCGVWFNYGTKKYATKDSAQRAVKRLSAHSDLFGEDYKVNELNMIMVSYRKCGKCARLHGAIHAMVYASRDIEQLAIEAQELHGKKHVGVRAEYRQILFELDLVTQTFLREYDIVRQQVNMEQLLKEQLLLSI